MAKQVTINDFADFWRYQIGVNVIPADTKSKRRTVAWLEFQNNPIPEEVYITNGNLRINFQYIHISRPNFRYKI